MLALLALFATGFAMWVAWEVLTGRRLLAPFLAIVSFVAVWIAASRLGAEGPWWMLLAEIGATALLIVAARSRGTDQPSD